ncbi:unnamed protein product [Pseudo-nitzschia multistriata]|uniref:Uncharacterized protein n=1 Tax=Pseudo-nitzschia multistriata TaxID=183589 RepID=A0A448Z965_9STRA|nr:unnamed protein product [Pseudo-nitzschia multistriata]
MVKISQRTRKDLRSVSERSTTSVPASPSSSFSLAPGSVELSSHLGPFQTMRGKLIRVLTASTEKQKRRR